MVKTISYIKKGLLLCFVSCVYNTKAQDKYLSEDIDMDVLSAQDMNMNSDTSQIKVISASRSTKYLKDIPVSIQVIKHDEIIRNHYTSLTDVLKALPGIRVSQPGSGQAGENFQIRGLTGNFYTKILLNGIPIKPSTVAGMPIGNQLPIRQAQRIEVIYGPAAAIYGADAVSGVINIITKEANKGTFVRGDINIGQYEHDYMNFMIGGKAGKNKNILQYNFYGSKTEFNNMNIREGYKHAYNPLHYLQQQGKTFKLGGREYQPLELSEPVLKQHDISAGQFMETYYPAGYKGSLTFPGMEELPASSHMIGVNMEYRGIRISYHNMYRRVHSSVGKSSFLYRYDNPQNYWGEYINRVYISYDKYLFDKMRSTTNLSNLIYRMDNNSSLGLTYLGQNKVYQYSASDDLLAEQIFTYTPARNLEIIAGGSYQYSGNLPVTDYLEAPFDIKQYNAYSNNIDYRTLSGAFAPVALTFYNTAAFVQGYYKIERFTFMGGSRYDINSLYGNKLSPRFAVLYQWSDKTTIRTSAGYAYKAPPSSLAYQSVSYPVNMNYDSIKYLVVPNSSLKPEEFKAYEIGMNHVFFDKIDFNLSLYYNEIKNLIINNNLPVRSFNLPNAYIENDTSTLLYRQNIPGAVSRLYGIQAGLKIENLIRPIQMDLEGSVTFTRQSQTVPGFKQIKEIFNSFSLTPRHLGQYKISFIPFENVYIRLEGIWMSNWLKVIVPFQRVYDELFKDIDGFYKMDAVINYSFNRHLVSFIKIDNVFDEKFGGLNSGGLNNGLPYNPQFGRYVQFGLTYTLN